MNELTIVSIVATGDLGLELDLVNLSEDLKSLDLYSYELKQENMSGLFLKIYENGPSITIFRTGSVNIRGAKTFEEISENKSLLKSKFSELGIDTEISGMKVTNIVFTADLHTDINLNELCVKLGFESIEYEPEQFPGLVYRLDSGVILVFSSGKLVLTGFTQPEDAKQAYSRIREIITDD